MISPRIAFCLTLVGVLLAGVPLLHLTSHSAAPTGESAAAGADAPFVRETLWVTVRYTGRPTSLKVVRGDTIIVDVTGDDVSTEGVWEGEVTLVASDRYELEASAAWPEACGDSAQAVSISLCPAGQGECTETQWTFPGETSLHSVFTFSSPVQP